MIKNDYDLHESLEGWLFWYDVDDSSWKCVEREDFIEGLKNPDYKSNVLVAGEISDLIIYIGKTYEDIN